jgi:hypothetical protein
MVDTKLNDCSMNGRTVLKYFLMKENVCVCGLNSFHCALWPVGSSGSHNEEANFLSKLETFMTNWAIFSV